MNRFLSDNSLSIGGTPLVKLNRITDGARATALAKVEGRNPSYSVKCRLGAVSVVPGHIRGLTNTVTLHVEYLYNKYHSIAAFAVASLLTLLALVTLTFKSLVEWGVRQQRRNTRLQVAEESLG